MINDVIDELLERNREELINADKNSKMLANGICYDGIIKEELFEENGKIIFLLKETNGNDSDGNAQECNDWSYRKWLEYQQYGNMDEPNYGERELYRTFYNLAMWVDILTKLDNEESFEEYCKNGGMSELNLRNNLGKTGVVNLKKTWGGGLTNWKDLKVYVQNEVVKDILRKQIAYISPRLVICGSSDVYYLAKQVWNISSDERITVMNKTLHYFELNGALYLEFYHPACRKKREYLYEYCKMVKKEMDI